MTDRNHTIPHEWRMKDSVIGVTSCLVMMTLCVLVGPNGIDSITNVLSPEHHALTSLRLHRVILGALVGASLAGAGAALQCILRNPLADPYIIGVSGGAALGGALALCFTATGAFLISGSLMGALGSMALLLWLAQRSHHPDGLLLLGIVFNAFAAALISFIKVWVSPEKIQQLVFWLIGTVNYPDTQQLIISSLVILTALLFLWLQRGRIHLLALGDEEAQRLGERPHRTRLQTYFACCLMIGFIVPQVGMIGFIGLIIPHLMRLLLGPDFRKLFPASLFAGAFFLMLCDAIVRGAFVWTHTELPVGALTAILGGPFFAWLLLKQYGQR